MKDGFVRVCSATPIISVADCSGNADNIIALIEKADNLKAKLVVFPEMCVTGYTAGDLLLQRSLIDSVYLSVKKIVDSTAQFDIMSVIGAPVSHMGRLYNCAVFIKSGRVLGIVPKLNPPNYSVYYELRHFAPGFSEVIDIDYIGQTVPFGGDILFECENVPNFIVAAEICEDLWVPDSPSARRAMAGATVIVNLSASDESVGKSDYRRSLVTNQSAKLICAYVYADAGEGESSTDLVFSGQDIICENGTLLAESERYSTGIITADIDIDLLDHERRRMNTFGAYGSCVRTVKFSVRLDELNLTRYIDPMPFVPSDTTLRAKRCEEILDIQARGLAARLKHIRAKSAVVAVSGGLDSTLAMLVTARAFDICSIDRSGITAITMPCFGTTHRTRSNAEIVSERLGADFVEIPISESVKRHFEDIGQSIDEHDVTYENAQARERTQVLMDIANKKGGIAIGTGDLSELALGWATYNGDHMSMYAVNASVPKTLVRYLVKYEADNARDAELANALNDILDTPVSPELLPPVEGEIAQKTEDIVGPYELHDFFIYNLIRRGYTPEKVLRLAKIAFNERYDENFIRKWLKTFCRRFINQQFKRSCMPDGPKVGSVAFSPRGDLRMPSDASQSLWKI